MTLTPLQKMSFFLAPFVHLFSFFLILFYFASFAGDRGVVGLDKFSDIWLIFGSIVAIVGIIHSFTGVKFTLSYKVSGWIGVFLIAFLNSLFSLVLIAQNIRPEYIYILYFGYYFIYASVVLLWLGRYSKGGIAEMMASQKLKGRFYHFDQGKEVEAIFYPVRKQSIPVTIVRNVLTIPLLLGSCFSFLIQFFGFEFFVPHKIDLVLSTCGGIFSVYTTRILARLFLEILVIVELQKKRGYRLLMSSK